MEMTAPGQPLAYYAAFFTGAWLRRMVAYAGVVYGFEVLGGGTAHGLRVATLIGAYGVIAAFAYPAFLAVTPETVERTTALCVARDTGLMGR